jgi:hypothetical protein
VILTGANNNVIADAIWLVKAPTTTGIANITHNTGALTRTVNLASVFADPQEVAIPLQISFEHTGDYSFDADNWSLFESFEFVPATESLVIHFTSGAQGTGQIKVRATNAAGLSVASTFSVTVSNLDKPPEIVDARVLSGRWDDPLWVTPDGIITGMVTNDNFVTDGSHLTNVTVEFYYDGQGAADYIAPVDAAGRFYHALPVGSYDNLTLVAKQNGLATPSATFEVPDFLYDPIEDLAPAISGLSLVHNTGSAGDNLTADPRIRGVIENDNVLVSLTGDPADLLIIDVDLDNNLNTVELSVPLGVGLSAFDFTPPNLVSDANTNIVLHVRAQEWKRSAGYVPGDWETFTFRYDAGEGNDGATLAEFALDGPLVASEYADPTVSGRVENDGAIEGLLVELDIAEQVSGAPFFASEVVIDAAIYTDADGEFTFFPAGLPYGANAIRARVAERQYGSSSLVYSDWTTLEFTLKAEVETATLGALALTNNAALNPDDSTYDPTVEGEIATSDLKLEGTRIEFDVNGDSLADTSTTANAEGEFTLSLPLDSPGTYRVRARAVQNDRVAEVELIGAWGEALQFSYQPWTGPTIADLEVPDGEFDDPTWTALEPKISGVIESPFDKAFARIEFDYDGDGIAEEATVADSAGNFSFSPSAHLNAPPTESAEADYSIHVRATSPNQDGAPVVGDWITAPLLINILAAEAPAVTLALQNATGGPGNPTTNPTLVGHVGVANEALYAFATIQFDYNADGVPDATGVANENADFEHFPAGLEFTTVTIAARSVVLHPVNDDLLYGAWTTLQFEYADPIAEAEIPSVDNDEDWMTEAARYIAPISERASTTAATEVRAKLHSVLTTAGFAPSATSGQFDVVIGVVAFLQGTRDTIVPNVGSYNMDSAGGSGDGLITAAGYESAFELDAPTSFPTTNVSGASTQTVQITGQEFTTTPYEVDAYHLTGPYSVAVDYTYSTLTRIFTIDVAISFDYEYAESGSYTEWSLLQGAAVHGYQHSQSGEYSFSFHAEGQRSSNGQAVSGYFQLAESLTYEVTHVETDAAWSQSESGVNSGGLLDQEYSADYSMERSEVSGTDLAEGFSKNFATGDSSLSADYELLESGGSNLSTTNAGSYTFDGSFDAYHSNNLSRVDIRKFTYDYEDSGEYLDNDGTLTVDSDELYQETTHDYSRSQQDTVTYSFHHAGRNEASKVTLSEGVTHQLVQTIAGEYSVVDGEMNLTLDGINVGEFGTISNARTENGELRYDDTYGYDGGAFNRTDSNSSSYSYSEHFISPQSLPGLEGMISGQYGKDSYETRSYQFSHAGSHSFSNGELRSEGNFARKSSLTASHSTSESGSYTKTLPDDGQGPSIAMFTGRESDTLAAGYEQDATYDFSYPGDTTRSGKGRMSALGNMTSSYTDQAVIQAVGQGGGLLGTYIGTENNSAWMSLSAMVKTDGASEHRVTRGDEVGTHSLSLSDAGAYTFIAGAISQRTGQSRQLERNNSQRDTWGSGEYTLASDGLETHVYSQHEGVSASSSSTETATYTQYGDFSSTKHGTIDRFDTRTTSLLLLDTVTYDRAERDGTLTVSRTEQASYSYDEDGTITMVNELLVSHKGDFTRLESDSAVMHAHDQGVYDAPSSSGTYSVYTDTTAKNLERIDDGHFTLLPASRTEGGNYTNDEYRYTTVKNYDKGAHWIDSDPNHTTTSTITLQMWSESELTYHEAGEYLDAPGDSTRSATYQRKETGDVSTSATGTYKYQNVDPGDEPGVSHTANGDFTFDEQTSTSQTHHDVGGFLDDHEGLTRSGWFSLTEMASTTEHANGTETVNTYGVSVSGHSVHTSTFDSTSTSDYTESGTYSEANRVVNRFAEFERAVSSTESQTVQTDASFRTSVSAGKATIETTATTVATFDDVGKFSVSGTTSARTGQSKEFDSSTTTLNMTESGDYVGESRGPYSAYESGSRMEKSDRTIDYLDRSGYSPIGSNGTTQSGNYEESDSEFNRSGRNASGTIVAVKAEGKTNGEFALVSRNTHSEQNSQTGSFREMPNYSRHDATFTTSRVDNLFDSFSASTNTKTTGEHLVQNDVVEVISTINSSSNYSGAGKSSDHVDRTSPEHQNHIDQHDTTVDYKSKDVESTDESTLVARSRTYTTAESYDNGETLDELIASHWDVECGPADVGLAAEDPTFELEISTLSSDVVLIDVEFTREAMLDSHEVEEGRREIHNGAETATETFTATYSVSSSSSTSLDHDIYAHRSTQGRKEDQGNTTTRLWFDEVSISWSDTATHSAVAASSASATHVSTPTGYTESGSFDSSRSSDSTVRNLHDGTHTFELEHRKSLGTDTSSSKVITFDVTKNARNHYQISESVLYVDDGDSANLEETREINLDSSSHGEKHTDTSSRSDQTSAITTDGTREDELDDWTQSTSVSHSGTCTDSRLYDRNRTGSTTQTGGTTIDNRDYTSTQTTNTSYQYASGGIVSEEYEVWTSVVVTKAAATCTRDVWTWDSNFGTDPPLSQRYNSCDSNEMPELPAWNKLVNSLRNLDAHTVLDAIGMIPDHVFGPTADLLNAALYLSEGNKLQAGLSLVSALPAVGNVLSSGMKTAVKGAKALDAVATNGKLAAGAARAADKFSDGMKAGKNMVSRGLGSAADQALNAGRSVGLRVPATKCDVPFVNRAFNWCFAEGTLVVVCGAAAVDVLAPLEAIATAPTHDEPVNESAEIAAASLGELSPAELAAGAIGAMGVASVVHARRKRKSRIAAAGLHDRLLDSANGDYANRDCANDEGASQGESMPDTLIDELVLDAVARDRRVDAREAAAQARESALLALTSEPLRTVPAPKLVAKPKPRATRSASTSRVMARSPDRAIAPTVGLPSRKNHHDLQSEPARETRWNRAIELLGSGPAIAIWILLVATAWLALPKSWVTSEKTAAVDAHRAVATSNNVASDIGEPKLPSREALLRRVAEDPLSVQAYMPIEDVREGDLVVARDDATGELVARPVTQLFRNTSDHLRQVTYATAAGVTRTIATTDEHPFWTEEDGWKPSKDLETSDELQQIDGETAILLTTLRAEEPNGVAVYNFEVEGAHNYFVASANTIRGPPEGVFDAVLVHNKCAPGKWTRVNESMSKRAAVYQTFVTKRTGSAYLVNGVKFDGIAKGILLEAKGHGYKSFVKGGEFRTWFKKGHDALLAQARRQFEAARGVPIQWHVAEKEFADVLRQSFRDKGIGVSVIFSPIGR